MKRAWLDQRDDRAACDRCSGASARSRPSAGAVVEWRAVGASVVSQEETKAGKRYKALAGRNQRKVVSARGNCLGEVNGECEANWRNPIVQAAFRPTASIPLPPGRTTTSFSRASSHHVRTADSVCGRSYSGEKASNVSRMVHSTR